MRREQIKVTAPMTPIDFPGTNCTYGPPADMAEEQVRSIRARVADIRGGSCDGLKMVIVAHMPTPEELEQIKAGNPIFITMVGGLSPHFLTTNLSDASNPA